MRRNENNLASQTLVTGGAGFIGSHLCRKLVALGHPVTSLDIADPKQPVPGVHYRKGDVRTPGEFADLVRACDVVYHFAALVSVAECESDPVTSYATNLTATLGLLRQLEALQRDTGKKRLLVFAGSSAVYGTLGETGAPISEDLTLAPPLSFYGAQKLASEQAIRLYAQRFSIPSVVFRFFNVYGPGQDPSSPYSGVVSIFVREAKRNGTISLHGGGSQTRDFVSVHDVADACVRALEVDSRACDGAPINLGTGESVTIRRLAEIVRDLSGSHPELRDDSPRVGDVLHSRARVERAKAKLGWTATTSLEAGLRELLA